MSYEKIKWVSEMFSYWAVIGSVLFSAYTYRNEKKKDRKVIITEAYLKCSDHYIDLLKLTLDHPSLNYSEYSNSTLRKTGFSSQEATMYLILFLTLEQGHYQLTQPVYEVDPELREIWEQTLNDWTAKPEFEKAWKALDFKTYMAFRNRIESGFKYMKPNT